MYHSASNRGDTHRRTGPVTPHGLRLPSGLPQPKPATIYRGESVRDSESYGTWGGAHEGGPILALSTDSHGKFYGEHDDPIGDAQYGGVLEEALERMDRAGGANRGATWGPSLTSGEGVYLSTERTWKGSHVVAARDLPDSVFAGTCRAGCGGGGMAIGEESDGYGYPREDGERNRDGGRSEHEYEYEDEDEDENKKEKEEEEEEEEEEAEAEKYGGEVASPRGGDRVADALVRFDGAWDSWAPATGGVMWEGEWVGVNDHESEYGPRYGRDDGEEEDDGDEGKEQEQGQGRGRGQGQGEGVGRLDVDASDRPLAGSLYSDGGTDPRLWGGTYRPIAQPQLPPLSTEGWADDPVYRYYASGEYDADTRAVVAEASELLLSAADRGELPPNALVVFDIDDTLICTHPHKLLEHIAATGDYLRDPEGVAFPAEEETFYPPIPAVVRLHNELHSRGIRTALLTGRHAENARQTLANLRAAGVSPAYECVIFREAHESGLSAVEYKSRRRANLAREFVVVACFGDQISDLEGDHVGLAVRLPNPQYIIH